MSEVALSHHCSERFKDRFPDIDVEEAVSRASVVTDRVLNRWKSEGRIQLDRGWNDGYLFDSVTQAVFFLREGLAVTVMALLPSGMDHGAVSRRLSKRR